MRLGSDSTHKTGDLIVILLNFFFLLLNLHLCLKKLSVFHSFSDDQDIIEFASGGK